MILRRGSTLAEIVVGIGLLGGLLLVVAMLACRTTGAGRHQRQLYEASALAQDLLDARMAESVEDLAPGPQALVHGIMSDGTAYTATLEVYGLGGSGPAVGLSDAELKRLRVVIQWRQRSGPGTTSAETYLAKIPR